MKNQAMLKKQFQSRYRVGARIAFSKEYYLDSGPYRKWLSVIEITKLKECDLSENSLRNRMFNSKRVYDDLWDAITYQKQRKGLKHKFDITFMEFMFLMPIGSLHKNALAMQSKTMTKGKQNEFVRKNRR